MAVVIGMFFVVQRGVFTSRRDHAVSVTAEKLFRDYDGNAAAADERYRGRAVRVRGSVTKVDKGVLDDTIVRLDSSHIILTVDAYLAAGEESRARSLSKGDQVALVCDRVELFVGSPRLDGCTFP